MIYVTCILNQQDWTEHQGSCNSVSHRKGLIFIVAFFVVFNWMKSTSFRSQWHPVGIQHPWYPSRRQEHSYFQCWCCSFWRWLLTCRVDWEESMKDFNKQNTLGEGRIVDLYEGDPDPFPGELRYMEDTLARSHWRIYLHYFHFGKA